MIKISSYPSQFNLAETRCPKVHAYKYEFDIYLPVSFLVMIQ